MGAFHKMTKLRALWAESRAFHVLTYGLAFSLALALVFALIGVDILDRAPVLRYDALAEGWLFLRFPRADASIWAFISLLGNSTLIAGVSLLLAAWYVWKKYWFYAAGLLASVFGGGVLTYLLKGFFHRPRPVFPYLPINDTEFSFPSGHAAMAMIFYGFLVIVLVRALRGRKGRWLAALGVALVPLVVGISRLLLGVHFPSDVFAGWLVGAAWLSASLAVTFVLQQERVGIFGRLPEN